VDLFKLPMNLTLPIFLNQFCIWVSIKYVITSQSKYKLNITKCIEQLHNWRHQLYDYIIDLSVFLEQYTQVSHIYSESHLYQIETHSFQNLLNIVSMNPYYLELYFIVLYLYELYYDHSNNSQNLLIILSISLTDFQ